MTFRPLSALAALRAVLRDPDDTAQVFRLVSALSGRTPKALIARFAASRGGARLLEARPNLLDVLHDREALAALPEGSLGRAYLRFVQAADLTADGLVQASAAGAPAQGEVEAWIGDRLRDSHDVWHVVTGYGTDLLGESALLAFTFAQTRAPGIGLLVAAALLRADDPDARRLILDGFVRGVRAAWLPAASWESLLAEDLNEVRRRLRVGDPPAYEPFWSHELADGGLLGARAA
jgi:ubiquinone biosynthesis protein COQ4